MAPSVELGGELEGAVEVEVAAVALLEPTVSDCESAVRTAALDEVDRNDASEDEYDWRTVCDGATSVEDELEDDVDGPVICVIVNAGLVLPELPKTSRSIS